MTKQDDAQLYSEAFRAKHGFLPMAGGEFQPGEPAPGGQGGSDDGGSEPQGFVDSYLTRVPEDYRPHVEPYIREVERNTNKKFQEHADFRKQWEPYEELNLTEYDPEDVQQLLQFAEIASDEDAFKEWVAETAQELGLLEDDGGGGDEWEYFDEENPDEVIDQSTIQQAISEQLNEALSPILERMREDDMQKQVDQANQLIDNQIEALKKEHGDFDENAVYRFALAYDGPDAIERGFEDYQDNLAHIEQEILSRKGGQPRAPEGEGRPNTAANVVTDFAEAKNLARERLAQTR